MLVLRRYCGQSIAIGKNAEIIIKVLRNDNDVITIGVDAPQVVSVERLELIKKRLKSSSNENPILIHRVNSFGKQIKIVPEDLLVSEVIY